MGADSVHSIGTAVALVECMKNSNRHSWPTLSVLILQCLAIASCATPGKKTEIGAGAGAVGGALVGGLAGGWKGAAIGAAAGGVAGGAVGNQLDRQANQLAKVADTKRTQDGILVNLKNDLLFDTGSSTLKQPAVDQLKQLSTILVQYPQDRVAVAGYTDDVGTEDRNLTLSEARAASVQKVLVDSGLPAGQVSANGYGEARPVDRAKTPTARAKNRRVELHIDMPDAKNSG